MKRLAATLLQRQAEGAELHAANLRELGYGG